MNIKANLWMISILGQSVIIFPYLLFNGFGLIIGLLMLDKKLKKGLPKYQKKVYTIFVFSILAGWIGAHIFDWAVRDKSFSQAGFTFYGGLIGALLFYIIVCYIFLDKRLIWPTLNSAVVPLVFAHAIGRIGCFFAGCCYGKPFSENHILASLFKVHPTQLYESGFLFLFGLVLLKIEKIYPLFLIYFYLIGYGVYRFFIEFLRGDERGFFYGLSTSQWVSLLIVFPTIGFIIYEKF